MGRGVFVRVAIARGSDVSGAAQAASASTIPKRRKKIVLRIEYMNNASSLWMLGSIA
jgi:hypothetical protein